jgi:hypothetical protein
LHSHKNKNGYQNSIHQHLPAINNHSQLIKYLVIYQKFESIKLKNIQITGFQYRIEQISKFSSIHKK